MLIVQAILPASCYLIISLPPWTCQNTDIVYWVYLRSEQDPRIASLLTTQKDSTSRPGLRRPIPPFVQSSLTLLIYQYRLLLIWRRLIKVQVTHDGHRLARRRGPTRGRSLPMIVLPNLLNVLHRSLCLMQTKSLKHLTQVTGTIC